MMHTEQYITVLDALGARFVAVERNSKVPVYAEWQNNPLTKAEVCAELEKGRNIGLLLGTKSGCLVDVDCDDDMAVRAAKLVFTNHYLVFGRPSRPSSHYLFFVNPEPTIKTQRWVHLTSSGERATLVELRGDGAQTVIPPSTHPSGEPIRWETFALDPFGEPQRVSYNSLVEKCQQIAALALLSKEWRHGIRHESALALAGWFARMGWSVEKAEQFIRWLCTLAHDHECADRVRAVRDTYHRHQRGEETVGFKTLKQYLSDDVARSLAKVFDYNESSEQPVKNTTVATPVEVYELLSQTEQGMAEYLSEKLRDRFFYHAIFKRWFVWDGRRWLETVEENLKAVVIDELKAIANEAIGRLDQKTLKQLINYLNERKIRNVVILLETFLRETELDPHPYLLNCRNGLLDLRTLKLLPHDPKRRITTLADTDFVEFYSEAWLDHIERCLPDPEIRRAVQRQLGQALAGVHIKETFPIWWGAGANGKTTTQEVIRAVLGDYACTAPPNLLVEGDRHPTEMASLYGKRLVFLNEMGGHRINTERLKSLTGGESIKARRMYGDFFEFQKSWTLIGITNTKPRIPEQDDGTWRRVQLVPWTVQIPPEERIPQNILVEQLLREREGILWWLIEGYIDTIKNPNWVAPTIEEATELYRFEEDPFGDFAAEKLVFHPAERTTAQELYQAYQEWCEQNNLKPLPQQAFGRYLASRGAQSVKLTGKKAWKGVGLKKGLENHW